MPQPKGQIDVLILEDGTCRIETGDMGGVGHKSADEAMREIARLLGGEVIEQKLAEGHHHSHDHEHGHGGTHHHA